MITRILVAAVTLTLFVELLLFLHPLLFGDPFWASQETSTWSLTELMWITASSATLGAPAGLVVALLIEVPVRRGVTERFAAFSLVTGLLAGAFLGALGCYLFRAQFSHWRDAMLVCELVGASAGLGAAILISWWRTFSRSFLVRMKGR